QPLTEDFMQLSSLRSQVSSSDSRSGPGLGNRRPIVIALVIVLAVSGPLARRFEAQQLNRHAFTVEDILGLPQPDNLVASPSGSAIAWTFNERGARNIYVAQAPDFAPRRVTSTSEDDGQELTNLSFSKDGKTIVYVRGGDHGSNRAADPPN